MASRAGCGETMEQKTCVLQLTWPKRVARIAAHTSGEGEISISSFDRVRLTERSGLCITFGLKGCGWSWGVL